jgi:ubiquinone/menaquinone biosynthesis C-methylase UbiE
MAGQYDKNQNKLVVAVYDKIAKFYDYEYKNTSALIDNFLKLVKKNGKILDVGCGVGKDTNYIHSKGFDVIGIDLSEGMIEIAKNNFPNIDFRIMDLRKIDFPDNYFDALFVAFSLVHIPKSEIENILKNFYRMLKKEGMIYFAIQEGKSKEGMVKSPYENKDKIFLNVFSEKEFNFFIKKMGFSLIKDFKRKPKENEFQYNKYFVLAKKQTRD